MMTYNQSYDGGTFEDSTPLQTFKCWLEFRQQALFQIEHYLSIERNDLATRYYKLLNFIEDRMRVIN